jgi:hypothetical protein
MLWKHSTPLPSSFKTRVRSRTVDLSRSLGLQPSNGNAPILHIPSASIYRFSASNVTKPVLAINWTIHEGEGWAIVGNAAEEKIALLEVGTLKSRYN